MKTEQIRGEVAIELSKIEERIFTIRGKQVMIDKDLALLY